ncbi:putative F-box protein [Tripterygium wilfordii]|uniref:Putative F-box protein n=1 Tax=Tripterygium wilfordii TaxID=458696 RepID=A0A7J7CP95_TRIWF|nr:putative F-box protein At1g65770 [Tripterygium wilfordii]KAF5735900.1 putative F-box protein [Tripterygium wilfordii]
MADGIQSWSSLPPELLELIGKFLDSRIDYLRFRSVCTSWRSSVRSFTNRSPLLPVKVPYSFPDCFLSQSTIYRLELINPSATSLNCSSPPQKKSWLVRIEESENGKLKLLSPLLPGKVSQESHRATLNLLNVKAVELNRAWTIKDESFAALTLGIDKVVVYPNPTRHIRENSEFSILAIYGGGKLGFWKMGDEEWSLLDDVNFHYDDIVVRRGQYYVVDRWGTIFWIDSSLKLIQYSPPLYGCGGRKYLLESEGSLHVVDGYLDGGRLNWKDYENRISMLMRQRGSGSVLGRPRRHHKVEPKAVGFRVHKLDEEWGEWVDVKSLIQHVFVLGYFCSFSVSTAEFSGCRGNCIYFADGTETYGAPTSCLFKLEDRSIGTLGSLPEYSRIFWLGC